MSDNGPKWKGQEEIMHFDLAQVTAIASAVRSEVFWAFDSETPMSAQDIAREIGKSAQTVRYHVNELVKVGLLIPVELRKRRSRVEEAYVQPARACYYPQPPNPPEFVEQMNKGFESTARSIIKERAEMVDLRNMDPSKNDYQIFLRWSGQLSHESALKMKKLLSEAIDEARGMGADEGIRVTVALHMSPTFGESRRLLDEMKKDGHRKPRRGRSDS